MVKQNWQRWLPLLPMTPKEITLVCLPHAGAGIGAYQDWASSETDFTVCPALLPGREARILERPHTDVGACALELAQCIVDSPIRSYALFGHSLGALVAFETYHALRMLGARPPVGVFVSGRTAPHRIDEAAPPVHQLPTERLLEVVGAYGGMDKRVLADKRLRDFIVPVLRADFVLAETYRYSARPAVTAALTALGGDADPLVGPDDLLDWGKHAGSRFETRSFSGDHFYLYTPHGRAEVLEYIHLQLSDSNPT